MAGNGRSLGLTVGELTRIAAAVGSLNEVTRNGIQIDRVMVEGYVLELRRVVVKGVPPLPLQQQEPRGIVKSLPKAPIEVELEYEYSISNIWRTGEYTEEEITRPGNTGNTSNTISTGRARF